MPELMQFRVHSLLMENEAGSSACLSHLIMKEP